MTGFSSGSLHRPSDSQDGKTSAEPFFKKTYLINAWLVLVLVGALGLMVSCLLFSFLVKADKDRVFQGFIQDSVDRISSVENSLVSSVSNLKSIASLYSSTGMVLRKEFRVFATNLIKEQRGLDVVGWVPVLPHDQRQALEEWSKKQGLDNFQVLEADPLPDHRVRRADQMKYYPVYFVEPLEDFQSILGMDLKASPAFEPALETAKNTGSLTATPSFGEPKRLGLIIPLYKGDKIEPTVEWRQANIAGFVFAWISPKELFTFSLNYLSPRLIRVEVFEQGSKQNRLYQFVPEFFNHRVSEPFKYQRVPMSYRESRYLGDRKFDIVCSTLPGYYNEHRSYLPHTVFVSTSIITFFLCLLIFRYIRFAQSVQNQVVARTAELKASRDELEASRQILQKVNAELDSFVYTASHDLRAPLRGITSFAQILQEDHGEVLDDDGKDCLNEIRKGVARMDALISDLLALSRASRIKNPFEKTKLSRLIQEAVDRFDYDIRKTGAVIKSDQDMPEIVCDRIKMTEVFANLLGNALKFSSGLPDRKPEISFKAEKINEEIEISVSDNGIGIDPKYYKKIFEIFTRLHDEDAYEGTGAGLSIVKRIVEEHQGTVTVKPNHPAGTVFVVRIPIIAKSASDHPGSA